MKCFDHPEGDATAQCRSCSRGLCHACTQRFSLTLCQACLLQHNQSVARAMYFRLGSTVIIFSLLAWVFLSMAPPSLEPGQYVYFVVSRLMLALFFSFAVWGWDFLDRHMRHLTYGTPLVWFFYLWVKLMLSVFIGLFVGPYQIYRMVKEIRNVRRTSAGVASGLI